ERCLMKDAVIFFVLRQAGATPSLANSKGLASPNPGICFLPLQGENRCCSTASANLQCRRLAVKNPALSLPWWERKRFQHLSEVKCWKSQVRGPAPSHHNHPSIERLQAGLGAAEDEGVHVVRALIGVDRLQVLRMPHHRIFDLDAVAAVHVARGTGDF